MSSHSETWTEVSLGEVCEFKYGKSLPESKRTGDNVPVYGSNGIVGWHNEALTDGLTIIVGRKGSFGEVNLSNVPCWPIDTTYYIDNSSTEADLKWLSYCLSNLGLKLLNRSAAIPGLNREDAYRKRLLLPPLEDQKRIADILDRAEALRAKRRAAIDQLDELIKATFFNMFGDPFTQKNNTVRLGDAADIFMGQSPPGSSYNSTSSGTPLLNGPTEFGEINPIEKQWTTKPTRLCEKGDILFCVRGATAGRLNRADKVYCLGRGLAAIRPRGGMAVNTDFLFTVLDRYYEYFQTKGVGSTFINISRQELENLPIPEVQHEKINSYSYSVTAVEKLKIAHKTSLAQLNELFTSLQYRAFRGEL